MIDIDDRFMVRAETVAVTSGLQVVEVERCFELLMLQMIAVQNIRYQVGRNLSHAIAQTPNLSPEIVPLLDAMPALRGTFKRYYPKALKICSVLTLQEAVRRAGR